MLEAIYSSLALVIVILALIFLILITVFCGKKSYNDVASIKVQIVFEAILFTLFVFKIIIAVLVAKSLGMDIFCAVLWAINIVLDIIRLKDKKGKDLKDENFEDEIEYL